MWEKLKKPKVDQGQTDLALQLAANKPASHKTQQSEIEDEKNEKSTNYHGI